MQPLTNDATTALLRAIHVNFSNFATGCALHVEAIRGRPWASVTFSGARHELDLRLTGPSAEQAAARLTSCLDSAEFKLRGHFVADIALVSKEAAEDGVRLRLEALTVEE